LIVACSSDDNSVSGPQTYAGLSNFFIVNAMALFYDFTRVISTPSARSTDLMVVFGFKPAGGLAIFRKGF
jgi:hypothetical protein